MSFFEADPYSGTGPTSLVFPGDSPAQVWVDQLNAAGNGWTEIGGGSVNADRSADAALARMAVIGGVPWVVYFQVSTTGGSPQLNVDVARLNDAGTGWVQLGPVASGGFDELDRPDIADINGKPYVAFGDARGGGGRRISVYRFDGSNWELVGGGSASGAGASPTDARIIGIAGVPWVSWQEQGNGVQVVRNAYLVNGAWTPASSEVNDDPSHAASAPSLAAINGFPWVGFTEDDGAAPPRRARPVVSTDRGREVLDARAHGGVLGVGGGVDPEDSGRRGRAVLLRRRAGRVPGGDRQPIVLYADARQPTRTELPERQIGGGGYWSHPVDEGADIRAELPRGFQVGTGPGADEPHSDHHDQRGSGLRGPDAHGLSARLVVLLRPVCHSRHARALRAGVARRLRNAATIGRRATGTGRHLWPGRGDGATGARCSPVRADPPFPEPGSPRPPAQRSVFHVRAGQDQDGDPTYRTAYLHRASEWLMREGTASLGTAVCTAVRHDQGFTK